MIVACIKAGPKFGPEYPNILFDMVRRNLPEGYEGEFVCFTDDATGLDEGIRVRPLPFDLPGWWSKLALFKRGLFKEGERIVFLDLDTVITGRIDELCNYNGPFAILRDAFRPDGLQSAVMAWTAGECSEIWDSFVEAGFPMTDPGGDQAWIERTQIKPAVRLQDALPRFFVSFKKLMGIPVKESVVFFHGHPRPHEVVDGWVPKVWKVGGLSRADLVSICNTEETRLKDHVRLACEKNLPWLKEALPHDGHVAIVAGGPSVADCVDEIKWRKSIGQQIWAVNGTAAFLRRNGLIPDAHIIVDARQENITFLKNASPQTQHYLASQCHPDLFGVDNITLWHSNSPGMAEFLQGAKETALVGGGSTAGLQALVIAHILGYRKIHLYGYDSSYREEKHHAYEQSLNQDDRKVTAVIGDRSFQSTPWMVQQAEEFITTSAALEREGAIITVHGDGLIPYIANNLPKQILPFEIRAHEVLSRLPEGEVIGAEIGVFAGDMSRALLGRENLKLLMVDSWDSSSYIGDSGDFHATLTQDQQSFYRDKAESRTSGLNREIMAMRSDEAAKIVPDNSLDFVFIDADHGYEGCLKDLHLWYPKVKPGGLFSGHDYENTDFPKFGVTQAVTEFAKAKNLDIELGDNFTWFARRHPNDCNSTT